MPHHHPPSASLCIHFYTFGHYYARPPTPSHPRIMHVECRTLPPPPRTLCARYTGLDPPLSSSFFSHRTNEAAFQDCIAVLREKLERLRRVGGCYAVTVSCQMGMHRSVAMAERLSRTVAGMGYKTSCNHLDLAQSKSLQQRKLRKDAEGVKAAEKRLVKEDLKVTREKDSKSRLVKENLRLTKENGRLERENVALAKEKERRMKEWMVEQTSGREEKAAAPRLQSKMQNVVKEPVAAGPIQYHGKPAPENAAAYKFVKPHGWVRMTALLV